MALRSCLDEGGNVGVSACGFSIYGGLTGLVVQVSIDSIYDEQTKEAYFNVIVKTSKSYLSQGTRRLPITPGTICTADINTGRKVCSTIGSSRSSRPRARRFANDEPRTRHG